MLEREWDGYPECIYAMYDISRIGQVVTFKISTNVSPLDLIPIRGFKRENLVRLIRLVYTIAGRISGGNRNLSTPTINILRGIESMYVSFEMVDELKQHEK